MGAPKFHKKTPPPAIPATAAIPKTSNSENSENSTPVVLSSKIWNSEIAKIATGYVDFEKNEPANAPLLKKGEVVTFPGLQEAAEAACHDLEVTPNQFIDSLDLGYDYPEILDPELARVYARSIAVTRPWEK